MKDKLKNHINEHRSEFDVYQTNTEDLWNDIEASLDKNRPRRINWSIVLRVAASITLLFVVAILSLRFANNSSRYEDGFSLAEISPELAEAEFYYSRLVDEKFALIRSNNDQLDPLITEEFEVLDSAYQDLKNDLKDNMDNEEVINAMIQNYRIKLQILEQILDNIELNKDEEIKNEEGLSI